ncbi:MAG: alpha/beta hydrolase [Leptospiraceae bacterium]|nr:alpha/beta hydrolase [Leptospiraceae bacterium]MCB1199859.1 alpha/beta hydrolase [Leptospiraceae bacterium]
MLEEFSVDIPMGKVAGLCGRFPNEKLPILALHGWLDNAASFKPLLSPMQRNFWAVDFPGHGDSFHLPAGLAYHFLDYIPFVQQVSDSLKLKKFVLMGHSMGAAVATIAAALMPAKVSALVLIEGFGPMSSSPEELVERGRKALRFFSRVSRSKPGKYDTIESAVKARESVGDLDFESARILSERNLKKIKDQYTWKYDFRLRADSILRLNEEQVRAYLKGIECPVMLITGQDAKLPYSDFIRKRIGEVKQLQHFDLPGGHHLHMQNAERCRDTITEFLGSLHI